MNATSATAPEAPSAGVEIPHWGYWVTLLPGLALLTTLSLSDSAYKLWCERVTTLFPRPLLHVLLAGAAMAHVGEAIAAYRIATKAGLLSDRAGWTLQTFVLGFPSLGLLRKRAAAVAAAKTPAP